MKIGILTSSRADFGIYLPLLHEMKKDAGIKTDIIVFGTHLSPYHGYTVRDIEESGFKVKHRIESLVTGDSRAVISSSIGLTSLKFTSFWEAHAKDFDIVLCIGDRYEMFAAVIAAIPFNVVFAHLHGGEKTLGAIDNVFRHSISHASTIHFTSAKAYTDRLKAMLDLNRHVYNVGALSLDNLERIKILSADQFRKKWGVDFTLPMILVTFHPETVAADMNYGYVMALITAIQKLTGYHFLITMPNADTAGNVIRQALIQHLSQDPRVKIIENLGTEGYFSAMKHAVLLIGNTSSGIIEAASFGKYVINIGNRQEGRIHGKNVLQVPIDAVSIIKAVKKTERSSAPGNKNIYYNGGAAKRIVQILKSFKANAV